VKAPQTETERRRARQATIAAILLFLRRNRRNVSTAFQTSADKASNLALPIAVDQVRGAVARAVLDGRKAARAASVRAFRAQTGAPMELSASAGFDVPQSASAAQSLAEQWGRRVIELGGDASAYARAADEREWAAARTAKTASMDAFNRESRSAAKQLSLRGVKVVRVWCSELELRTCSICYGLHDTKVGVDEEFPYGEPPLHPSCPCYVDTRIDDE
jgi:hypothetical protein